MKHNKLFNLLAVGCLLMTASCTKEDLVFDHEQPQFPTREGAYLLEVIMPQGTAPTDDIYICGAFNGGDDEAVTQDARWRLEKCENNNIKWGIYILPADMEQGTSLADGYHFVNAQLGVERSLTNTAITHNEQPALGGRADVTVERWASYFEKPIDPSEVEHDGYAIYVEDLSGWDAISLYAWGSDLPELFGGWPGAKPTGVIKIGETTYKYFDTGEANKGLNYNLIFNNDGQGTQLKDFNVTLDRDYYLKVTADGVEDMGEASSVTHDGYAIFCINNTGWEEIAMYAWGNDLPELFGGWPGVPATGTQTINGVEYTYWDCGESNNGLQYNFIANNNGGGKQIENNDVLGVVLDKNYYFLLNADLTVEAVDPTNPPVVGPVEPNPDPQPEAQPHAFYIHSELSFAAYGLYAWGDKEMFGSWPGLTTYETKNIGGAEYMVFNYEGAGETLNLILNDAGAGQQVDGPAVVADRDYYFVVNAEGWTEVTPEAQTYKLYIDDQTGWDAIAVYAWGDVEMFGGWPGATPEATETVGGVSYKIVEYKGLGEGLNLIFNNNGAGVQLPDYHITADRNYYLKVTAEGVTEVAQ